MESVWIGVLASHTLKSQTEQVGSAELKVVLQMGCVEWVAQLDIVLCFVDFYHEVCRFTTIPF